METLDHTQGEVLKQMRAGTGLTQSEVAEQLGISERRYGSYERDERCMTWEQMQQAKKVLGSLQSGVAVSSKDCNISDTYLAQYPSDDNSEIVLDKRITGRSSVPDRGKAHNVNTRWMGPWLDCEMVLAEDCKRIDGPARYVVRWSQGEDKVVVEAWRHSGREVAVRFHAPERTVIFEEVGRDGDGVTFEREGGSQIEVEILGKVFYPSNSTQLMTQGMADTASRIVNGQGD